MMKYLLVAYYVGFDLDDPEDLVNNSWIVGRVNTAEEVVDLVRKEFSEHINDQVENRFDLDDDDLDEDEVNEFRLSYEASIFSQINKWPKEFDMINVGELYFNGEVYFEDLKIELIKEE